MDLIQYSTRESDGKVKFSIPAEDQLRKLFGINFNGFHNAIYDSVKWKKLCSRLINTLERCIDVNVDTDMLHKRGMNRYIIIAKRGLEKDEDTNPNTIFALLGICIELLGGSPDNRPKLIVNKHKNNFYTGSYRSINYSISLMQKRNIIMKSAKSGEFKDYYLHNDLNILYEDNPKEFLNAFKERYPEAYAKLF